MYIPKMLLDFFKIAGCVVFYCSAVVAKEYAYVANAGSNTVSVIDTLSKQVSATVAVGNSPAGVAITPDGKSAYVANSGSNTISIIDISNNIVSATVTVGNSPQSIAITPDGKFAYVTNYSDRSVSVIEV